MTGKYWDTSWNVVTGCTPVSEGCENCWAKAMVTTRLKHLPRYARGFAPTFHEDLLTVPLHWRKPRVVFVALMGDLFHEAITDEQIDRVFAVMALCPQHMFLLCSKRAERMQAYLKRLYARGGLTEARKNLGFGLLSGLEIVARLKEGALPNVWLGCTAENQERADERLPKLLELAALGWRTWVSAEPMLGQVDVGAYLPEYDHRPSHEYFQTFQEMCGEKPTGHAELVKAGVGWVVCGGEQGKNSRPMSAAWARSLRDQCDGESVPFWFKQWGNWLPGSQAASTRFFEYDDWYNAPGSRQGHFGPDGTFHTFSLGTGADECMLDVGPHHAGRLLDGVEHNGRPF